MTLLAIRTALRGGTHAAAILVGAHVDEARLYPQIVRIDRNVLLLGLVGRIRDRRIQALCDRLGRTLVREFEDRERTRDVLAADQVDHETCLAGRTLQMS